MYPGVSLWQITLVYNADLGPHNFNPGNILLLLSYASTILVSSTIPCLDLIHEREVSINYSFIFLWEPETTTWDTTADTKGGHDGRSHTACFNMDITTVPDTVQNTKLVMIFVTFHNLILTLFDERQPTFNRINYVFNNIYLFKLYFYFNKFYELFVTLLTNTQEY